MTIQALGFGRAARQLQQLNDLIIEKLPDAARAGAQPAKERITENAPVGPTGNLKANVKDRPGESSAGQASHEVYVSGDAYYGFFVEYSKAGGSGGAPFFRPGIDQSRADTARAMEDEINEAFRRAT